MNVKEAIRRRRHKAYHEAGHAVVALLLGLDVPYTSLRNEPWQGMFGLEGTEGITVMGTERTPDGIKKALAALMAGPAAEDIFLGDWGPAGADEMLSARLMDELSKDDAERERICDQLQKGVDAMLKTPAATALLKAISGDLFCKDVLERPQLALHCAALGIDRGQPAAFLLPAAGGGIWKSIDGFGSSEGYFQLRKPGVGNCPIDAYFTQVGADGLLVGQVAVAPLTVVSTAGEGTMYEVASGGSEPSGWYEPSFDDSTWSASVALTGSTKGGLITGTQWICHTDATRPGNTTTLHRIPVVVAGSLASAIDLTAFADDWLLAVYFNGTSIWSGGNETEFAHLVLSISTDLIVEGTNLLAIKFWNKSAPDRNPTSVCYELEVS